MFARYAIRLKVNAEEHVVANDASRISIRVIREDAKDRMLWLHFSVGADGIVKRHKYEDMTFAIAATGDNTVVAGTCLNEVLASPLYCGNVSRFQREASWNRHVLRRNGDVH